MIRNQVAKVFSAPQPSLPCTCSCLKIFYKVEFLILLLPLLQVFPRDSTELPTSEQTVRAISSLRGAALPSPNCCEQIRPFADARCVCLPGYQRILPIGGFDAAYFEGATTILTLACRIPFLPCIETPPEEPAAVAAAGAG